MAPDPEGTKYVQFEKSITSTWIDFDGYEAFFENVLKQSFLIYINMFYVSFCSIMQM